MKTLSTLTSMIVVLLASASLAVFSVGIQFQQYKPTVTTGGGSTSSAGYRQASLVSQTAIGATGSAGYVMHHGWYGGPGTSVTAVDDPVEDIPEAFSLDAVYPHPFNPSTRIRFGTPEASRTRVRIYNLKGQLVRTLLDEPRPAGRHELVWNGRDDRGSTVASGPYLLRMTAGVFTAQRKVTLLK